VRDSSPTRPEDVERHERQLSLLICVTLLVMMGGMVALMYPVVFSHEDFAGKHSLQTAFLGFCVLYILLFGYFIERQRTIKKLRTRLTEDAQMHTQLQREASAELLHTLPDLSQFRDSLTMQFRRASGSQGSLSVIVVALKSAAGSDESETLAAFGDAAKTLSRRLREEDSIFRLYFGYFGILLPETNTAAANEYAHSLEDSLADAAGINNRFIFNLRVLNYPEDAGTAHELAEAVVNLRPDPVSPIESVYAGCK
jgi:GGDEF domain-containing protein